jgi:hypothetical protein
MLLVPRVSSVYLLGPGTLVVAVLRRVTTASSAAVVAGYSEVGNGPDPTEW